MRFLKLSILVLCALAVLADSKDDGPEKRKKRLHLQASREKRQHSSSTSSLHPRRSGARPPPYAVQMEPIARYSQRDPLYNPLADSKSDDISAAPTNYYGHSEDSPYNYYPTEPEPIIEIIIKESNESLPTPVPAPTYPPAPKTKKEPIQVFYVKYEKKQEYGEDKPRVVYDTPIPALTPVEEHEEIKPEGHSDVEDSYGPELSSPPVTSAPEPSTTLRAVIRPDSEIYHAPGNSGLRVTFGTDQVPPNNHNKRSDNKHPSNDGDEINSSLPISKPTALAPPGSSKRPHGPFPPLQPGGPPRIVSPGFPQQRIVNSFAQQQQQFLGPPASAQPGPPPNFALQPQFHQQVPPHQHVRNQFNNNNIQQFNQPQPQQHRPAITIQGLPELQQRLPFNAFAPSLNRLNVNPSFSPQLQLPPNPSPAANFLFDPHRQQYKEQQLREQEKQRYFEQQRQIEQRQQEQKRQLEQQRLLEQRRKQEYQQQQQQQQQQQYQSQQFGKFQQQSPQQQSPQQPPKQLGGEILKAIPKLEQHYAIRENPLHPGPFPPNPQYAEIPQTSFGGNNQNQNQLALQQSNLIQQTHQQQIPQQQLQAQSNYNKFGNGAFKQHNHHQHQQKQQPNYHNQQQQFFAQNLPTAQQQRPSEVLPQPQPQPQQQQQQQQRQQSSTIWGRTVFQSKNFNSNNKIYATPVTKTANDDVARKFASTPNSIRYSPTSPRPTIQPTRPSTTPLTTTPTPTTSTTLSPRNEAKIKENIANLPDEVPDDIREQLLSSGILGNADIQILDYDKVGGINIGDLPPEALANFYGAGGAAATSASEPVPRIAKRPKSVQQQQQESEDEVQTASASSTSFGRNSIVIERHTEEVTLRPGGVEMKVVRFDPNTVQGQSIAERHIQENATRLSPVTVLGSENEPSDSVSAQYNRYLPLKVSGTSFPIPDVPELQGKKISSVVVLAPVQPENAEQTARQSRKIAANDVQAIRFLAGESLKQLVKKPSAENYKRWLDHERQTEPQRQSVVLLVTAGKESGAEKEIFMYDVTSESVSKLAGDLSTAFVDAAESNSDADEDPMESARP